MSDYVKTRAEEVIRILSPDDKAILAEYYEEKIKEAEKGRPISDFASAFGFIFAIIFGIFSVYSGYKYLNFITAPPPPPAPLECPENKPTPLVWSYIGQNIYYMANKEYLCLRLNNSSSFYCEKLEYAPESLPETSQNPK